MTKQEVGEFSYETRFLESYYSSLHMSEKIKAMEIHQGKL